MVAKRERPFLLSLQKRSIVWSGKRNVADGFSFPPGRIALALSSCRHTHTCLLQAMLVGG